MNRDFFIGRRVLCSAPHAIGTGCTKSVSLESLSNGFVLPVPKGPVTEYMLSESLSSGPVLPVPKGPVTGYTLSDNGLAQPHP